MVTGVEGYRTRQIEPELGWQARPPYLNLTGVGQPTQLLHQRLLFIRQTSLLGLIPQFGMIGGFTIGLARNKGGCRDRFEAGDRMTETTHLEPEAAFRQLRQGLTPIVQQPHGKVRPARHGRQWQAEAQTKHVTGPVTGEHSKLLDQFLRSVPNQCRAVRRPQSDRRAGG
ncbi:hypothetical protein D3C76_432300 [compost metagenome]